MKKNSKPMKNKTLQGLLPKGKQVLAVLLLMLVFVPWDGLRAQTTYTVNGGTNTCTLTENNYIPFRGYWNDNQQKNEFIIPAAMLQTANMWSGTIHSMKFYLDQPSTSTNHSFDGTYQVFLADLKTQTNHSTENFIGTGYNSDSYSQYNPIPQVVYTGGLSIVNNEMTITFTTDFYHNGSAHLLVGIYTVTPGTNGTDTYFLGVTGNQDCYPSYYTYTGLHEDGNVGKRVEGFCPKVTFTAGAASKKLTVQRIPSNVDVGKVSINGGAFSSSVSVDLGQNTTVALYTTQNSEYSSYTFKGWAIGSPTNTIQSTSTTWNYTFPGTANVTVYAVYEAPSYTLTYSASPSAGGTVTVKNGATNVASGSSVSGGTSLNITATPSTGYDFIGWTISGTSASVSSPTGSSTTMTMGMSNTTLTGSFAKQTFTVNAAKETGVSTAYVREGTSFSGTSTSATVEYNGSATFQATVSSGYTFDGWYNGTTKVSSNTTYTHTNITSALTLTAKATPSSFTISASANPTAGGTVSGDGTYNSGASCTLTATAGACYTFTNWTEGGTVVSTNPTYTFTVSGDRTLVANFMVNTYSITAKAGSGVNTVQIDYGTAGATVSATANECDYVYLSANLSEGSCYVFDGWYDENGNKVSADQSYSFQVSESVTYTAKTKMNVEIYRDGTSDLIVNGQSYNYAKIQVNYGDVLTVETSVQCPYEFVGWKVYNSATGTYDLVSTDMVYTFTVTECFTLYAVGERDTRLWTDVVTSDPGTDHFEVDGSGNVTIKSTEGLAWLISYVNGFNNVAGGPHNMSGKTVTLEPSVLGNGVYMYDHIWVPIGFDENTPFRGTFNGNYHNITGIHLDEDAEEISILEERLTTLYGSQDDPVVLRYSGMFGYTEGATIKNTFMLLEADGCDNNNFKNDWISCKADGGYLGMLVAYGKDLDVESCYGAYGLGVDGDLKSAGGLVGHAENVNGHHSIRASWANSHLVFWGGKVENAGGLVGSTNEEVKYCYVITDDLIACALPEFYDLFPDNHPDNQGAIVGYSDNFDSISNVYIHPYTQKFSKVVGNASSASNTWYAIDTVTFTDVTAKFTAPRPNTYCNDDNTVNGIPLAELLNSNMEDDPDMAGYRWISPHTNNINVGYPLILKTDAENTAMAFLDITSYVQSEKIWLVSDFIMNYDDIVTFINTLAQSVPGISSMTFNILLYSNGDLSNTFGPTINHNIFIDENVSVTQSTDDDITAYAGITLNNYSEHNGEENRDWHMFSSAIEAGKIGISYKDSQSTGENLTFGDDYSMMAAADDIYFPSGITSGKQFDIYSFFEPDYHWINLKRTGNNHYHQDGGAHITYNGGGDDDTNETTYTPGKGYLMAIGDNVVRSTYLQAKGVLNNGTIDGIKVTSQGENLTGYNFLGNPYQSYLDFAEFADENSHALWSGSDAMGYRAYLVYDANEDGFVEYLADNNGNSFSDGAAATVGRYLHPHQGFFVVRNAEGTSSTVKFTNDMRSLDGNGVAFRNAHNYPLVNLFCTDSDGKREVSVIELDRPSNAGSLKMKRMLTGMGNMYIHWDNEDFKSMFLDHTPNYVPVWFEAVEDGVFTMTWSTANANFGYMHLVDNMTGADIDCLANDSYSFEARVNDMQGRFRLVFNPLGIEEETTTEPAENFAFVNGNELVVNGEGELSLIDLNGRILATEHVSGQQSHITMPKVAVGMYMLRLTNGKETKVQKIVVRK